MVSNAHRIVIMQTVGVLTILGAEPILPKDAEQGELPAGHEGEGVAARSSRTRGLILKMIDINISV